MRMSLATGTFVRLARSGAATLALTLLLGGCEGALPADDGGVALPEASGADGKGPARPDGSLRPDSPIDWCAARAILHENCVACHGVPPVIGPVSLVTIDDLRLWSTNHGKYVYDLVGERIHDAPSPMPPIAWNDPLTPEELGTLDAWIAAGAQPATCDQR
jgi:hypothetical protein